VGELAQQLFPGGIDASPETPYLFQQSVIHTRKLIDEGAKIIYEAAFQFNGVLAAIDILVNKNGKWKAYEVKSSTEVKPTFLLDASLQYHVITNSGIPLSDISIVYMNNQYVKHGSLDIKELFAIESVKKDAIEKQEFIVQKITELKNVIKLQEVPKMDIGPHCTDPYDCDFMDHCWSHIPENSVFDISGLRADKKFALYEKGIIRYEDIKPGDLTNEKYNQQVELFIKKSDYIDKKGIKEFLKDITYPLYFLDFETFNPAIPLYDQSKPYQQIPFQYSLHFQEKKGSSLKHFEYLADPNEDPRHKFIEQLLADTSLPGDILTYNQSFEKGRLKELALDFPQYSKKLHDLIERIKDLMTPFRQRQYYIHTMHGSYSIKQVLPAVVPELSYENLAINNGGDASLAFMRMAIEKDADYTELRKQMLEYCGMDTFAMVKIFERLNIL
jgi:predicted RecB family nuclease